MKLKIILICLLALILFLSLDKILAKASAEKYISTISTTVYAETSPTTAGFKAKLSQVERNNQFNNIAQCESQNDPYAKNLHSTASGRFQFLWGTWNQYGKELWGDEFYTKNIWDYNDNTELAWYVYTTYGTKDWLESKWCWDKTQ